MLEPTLSDGKLAEIIKKMRASDAEGTKLHFVPSFQESPYEVENGADNQDITLCGFSARYVGVARADNVAPGNFIVSDGFKPCVPVVSLERNACSLAHCNGIGGIDGYAAKWDRVHACIIVVAKERECKQRQVADAIFKKLKTEFRTVDLCELPTADRIGVIVRGDTILVYHQKL